MFNWLKANSIHKVAFASFIGTTIEWYDFFLYGTAAALVFNRLFFPEISPMAGIMAAYATYSVGFFARPLGGILFGHFGDKFGRKTMLIYTLGIMGIASCLIGIMPTYHQIGLLAPVLLTVLRFFQGLAVGGEWGGAILMSAEHSTASKRGFFASLPQAGAPMGLVLSSLVFTIFSMLSGNSFLTWGWRIPFILGIILVVVGLIIRMSLLESPLFMQQKEQHTLVKIPFIELLKNAKAAVLIGFGARFAENATYYLFSVFVLSYTTVQLHLSKTLILVAILIASIIEVFTIPFFGRLSDHWGRRPVYLFGAGLIVLFAFPFFWLLQTQSSLWVIVALSFGLGICHAAMYGPQAAFLSELFSTPVRYSGASLAYQLAAAFAGGLTPLVATSLLIWWQNKITLVACYLIIMGFISIISIYFAKESVRTDI